MPHPFIISHRRLSFAVLKPAQLWSSLSPDRTVLVGRPRKKALLIAINYTNAPPEHHLKGPQRDVNRLKSLLISRFGYEKSAIVVLTDAEDRSSPLYPTRDNIMREVKTFLKGQRPGDHHLFYFAGHSYQRESDDEGEEDGKDELIIPVDACIVGGIDHDKTIADDVLKIHLVDPLKAKNRLVAIFDSCHSGTLLDLPHYRCNGVYSWTSRLRRIGRRGLELVYRILKEDYSTCEMFAKAVTSGAENRKRQEEAPKTKRNELSKNVSGKAESQPKPSQCSGRCSGFCLRLKSNKNNVLCLSACEDGQVTWDDGAHESMTTALINLLERKRRPTLKKVMRELSSRPSNAQEGTPQLSSRFPLRMNSLFKI